MKPRLDSARRRNAGVALAMLCLLPVACVIDLGGLSSGGSGGAAGGATSTTTTTTTTTTTSATTSSTGTGGAGTGGAMPVTADQLAALVSSCNQLPGTTDFAPAAGQPSTIPICSLNGAVWWTSGMSIACDGGKGAACTSAPGYSPSTAGTDSLGNPLDASTVPFVVVPPPSNGFDYTSAGLGFGSVVAVLYEARLAYAVIGDLGDKGIVGEGSYALALALGINPNPDTGGVSSGVTYILFTGPKAMVLKSEDHAEAEQLGSQLAAALIMNN